MARLGGTHSGAVYAYADICHSFLRSRLPPNEEGRHPAWANDAENHGHRQLEVARTLKASGIPSVRSFARSWLLAAERAHKCELRWNGLEGTCRPG